MSPQQQSGQRGNGVGALGLGGELDPFAQRLGGFGGATQGGQHHGLGLKRGGRAWQALAPGAGRGQCLLASAVAQGDLVGAPEQLLIAPALGAVENDLIGRRGIAIAQLDLADQQVIEQLGIEAGLCGWGLDGEGRTGGRRRCRGGCRLGGSRMGPGHQRAGHQHSGPGQDGGAQRHGGDSFSSAILGWPR